jgi:hypothetical protein
MPDTHISAQAASPCDSTAGINPLFTARQRAALRCGKAAIEVLSVKSCTRTSGMMALYCSESGIQMMFRAEELALSF